MLCRGPVVSHLVDPDTAVTLRLAPFLPTKVAMAQFPNVEVAVSAVQEILNSPHGPHIRKSQPPIMKHGIKALLT